MTETTEPCTVLTDAAPLPVEQALSVALGKMRQVAAAAGTDDYFENWSREVLDRRPIALVAALLPWQTLVWVVEFDPESDGVLEAEVSPHPFCDGTSLDAGQAGVDSIKGKVLT